jgi:hypothetical protein
MHGLPPDAAHVGLGRSVAVDVDAGVGAGQATLGTGQLDPAHDLLLGGVAAQLGLGGLPRSGVRELVDPGFELGQRALERVETQPLDARVGPDRERPGGYLRWSIGT